MHRFDSPCQLLIRIFFPIVSVNDRWMRSINCLIAEAAISR
uniref:Uncharacterized protein n=1 Tax=Anguilla anguilla TaxID=7936 RepID=A0A0E9WBA4_ANGAN